MSTYGGGDETTPTML